jgi:Flp pilus assembly protein TadD
MGLVEMEKDTGVEWTISDVIDLAEQGGLARAIRTVSELMTLGEDDAGAWAVTAQLAPDCRTASICWRQALRLRPGDPIALRELARLQALARAS